jgi:hypothetical protein
MWVVARFETIETMTLHSVKFGRRSMDSPKRILVSGSTSLEDLKEKAILMYTALTGKPPSAKDLDNIDQSIRERRARADGTE